MSKERKPDWDPTSEHVTRDQRADYDEMREGCPVAHSDFMGWSLFRHEDVSRALHDHATFSNAVSRHLSVPNGMDPPEHTEYRRIIEPYFTAERMRAFEPACRQIVVQLVQGALAAVEVELMSELALPFAARVQCAFLGWPARLHDPLVRWARKNASATLAGDREALSEIAREFEGFIDEQLDARSRAGGAEPEGDLTAELMHEQVRGRPLSNEEIASIVRNWTAGEIGTIAASVGIVVNFLAQHAQVQQQLRSQRASIPVAIDEILRLHGPLVANRRVTTRAVTIGGRQIGAGERISLNWIAANRDGQVFDEADHFRLDRDPAKNLLYGAGIHVCPGAPLARMELRVVLEELLGRSSAIQPMPGQLPARAIYPSSGFAVVPVRIL
jgi:cytochrome P450